MLNLFNRKKSVNLSDVIKNAICYDPIKIEFANMGKIRGDVNCTDDNNVNCKKANKFHLNRVRS